MPYINCAIDIEYSHALHQHVAFEKKRKMANLAIGSNTINFRFHMNVTNRMHEQRISKALFLIHIRLSLEYTACERSLCVRETAAIESQSLSLSLSREVSPHIQSFLYVYTRWPR